MYLKSKKQNSPFQVITIEDDALKGALCNIMREVMIGKCSHIDPEL